MKKFIVLLSIFLGVVSNAQKNETEVKEINTEENNEVLNVPLALVEEAPVHPDCIDKSNSYFKNQCMNQMIAKHIQKTFRYDNVSCVKKEFVKNEETGKEEEICTEILKRGYHRVYIMFTIDVKGEVANIKVVNKNAEHFASEVKRVLNLLPKMKPGTQRGKPVNVKYALPLQLKY